MSQYHTFTASDAVAYAQQFGGIENPSELVSAQEVGDGNLNPVFKIFDTEGVSRIIVKQALPYVRCVGESWPLTPTARALRRKPWWLTISTARSIRCRLCISTPSWR